MPLQSAFTAIADVRPDARADLERVLAEIDADAANNAVLPFGKLEDVHFARLVILPESTDLKGNTIPTKLVLATNIDGSVSEHIKRLVETVPEGIDRVFSHCAGYPQGGSLRERVRFFEEHAHTPDAIYVNTVGRGLQQVLAEDELRVELQSVIDLERHKPGFDGMRPSQIHALLRDRAHETALLRWGTKPVHGLGPIAKTKRFAAKLAWPVVFAALGIAAFPLLPFYVVLLRYKEITDREDVHPPTLEHVRRIAANEDRYAQNPFSGVGYIKPGLMRHVTVRIALRLLDYGSKHIYNNGRLTGVTTIHFAHWIVVDEGRRVLFLSNYDGSLESYMSDFIDKVAWGLNLVFSNGVGWPKTSWFVFGGAKKEMDFKNYLRSHQTPTQVYYSAYPHLAAVNVANNAAIRRGLATRSMSDDQAQAWLNRF